MANIDATTPQLKAVKKWVEAYTTLDVDKVGPVVSKDFKFQSFPKTVDIPDEPKGAHIQKYRGVLTAMTKLEVRFQHRMPSRSQANTCDLH